MDDHSFDRLTVSLASRLARRRLLGSLLGLGSTALWAWTPGAAACIPCGTNGCRCGQDACCRGTDQKCVNGRCAPRHCFDDRKNLGETDVDCGGTCREFRECGLGERCEQTAACRQLLCTERPSFCPGARPGVKRCFQCRTDFACITERPRCLCGFCHECTRDADCPVRGGPTRNQFCVAPLAGNCPGDHPCKCRECRSNRDCLQGEFCDETNTCVGNTCAGCNDSCLCCDTLDGSEPFCAAVGGGSCEECSLNGCPAGSGLQCLRSTTSCDPCGTGSGGSWCARPCPSG